MIHQYFPKGIAKGEQFFNRHTVLKRLVGNIKAPAHTLILAPRRYGKSSLAKKAITVSKQPCAEIDLFVAIDEEDVGQKIIDGVGHIIQQVSDGPEQWFRTLKDYFVKANKKWTIGIKGVKLALIPSNPKTVPSNILEALNALEYILKKKNSHAVIFIDEFQEISETKLGRAIEGAIRHFAQETTQIAFVFSGSNRHMLIKRFKQRSEPLFGLCDEIILQRIEAKYYLRYLQKISLKTFNKKLSEELITTILELTNRHPRYVYLLCFEIWLQTGKKIPTKKLINSVWHNYIISKQKDVREELVKRSHVQRKLLEEIACGNNALLSSQSNQIKLSLSSSAITQALKVLEQLDYIEKHKDGSYKIIDPTIQAILKLHFMS